MIDVHFHLAYGARRVTDADRFSFEPLADSPGPQEGATHDSYMSARLLKGPGYRLLRWLLGISFGTKGAELDRAIEQAALHHARESPNVDRVVVLAFDQVHTDEGVAVGRAESRGDGGSDMYTSNTLVHDACARYPDYFLFGASIHPYRTRGVQTAVDMLDEVAAAGAVLVKWLPLVQNIRADDERTIAFLRRAGKLRMPMLIHYGGEKALSINRPEQADPAPLFEVLRMLRAEGNMPPVIIAHFATPSAWPFGAHNYFAFTARQLRGEFVDAEVYCDTSAMGLFTRARWLKRLLKRPDLQAKLVHGSDFPIPVNPIFFVRQTGLWWMGSDRPKSWVERDYQLKIRTGLNSGVMTRGWDILRAGLQYRMDRGGA